MIYTLNKVYVVIQLSFIKNNLLQGYENLDRYE